MGLLTKFFISYSICFVLITFKQIYFSIHLCIFFISCWINTVNLKSLHRHVSNNIWHQASIPHTRHQLWNKHSHTGAHTLRCNCTNTDTYLHSGLKPLTGIYAAVYWHKPWLQCSVIKSCRADRCLMLICSFFLLISHVFLGRLASKI